MKTSRFSEEKIIYALKQVESGTTVQEVCRQMGVSTNTYYIWKKKYGSMGICEARRLKVLEAENARLRKLVSDLTLDKHILQETIEKKLSGLHANAR